MNFGPTAFPGGALSVRESTREQVKTVSDLQTSLTILTSPTLKINAAAAPEGATLLPLPPPLPNVTHEGGTTCRRRRRRRGCLDIMMRELIHILSQKEGRVSPKGTPRWRYSRRVMVTLWRGD